MYTALPYNPKLTGERMNKVNEASPASKTSDVERVVICRTCDGKGKHTPQYAEAIVLLQAIGDSGNIDTLIDDAMRYMQVKHSRRKHVRKLLETFCRVAGRFSGI